MKTTADPMVFITRFIKFTGVGAIGTAAHYATLIFFVQIIGLNVILSSSVGAIVGACVNYILNYKFTFQSNKNHHETIKKFFTIAFIGFILNGLLMSLLAEQLSIYYLLAQIITTGTVLIWNFIGNQFWTFKIGKPP